MVKRLLMVGTVALGLLAVGIAPALADSASYVGQGGVATCAIPVGNTVTVPAAGVGGACFEVPAGATQAAIEAHDDFGPPPVLAVSFGVFALLPTLLRVLLPLLPSSTSRPYVALTLLISVLTYVLLSWVWLIARILADLLRGPRGGHPVSAKS